MKSELKSDERKCGQKSVIQAQFQIHEISTLRGESK